MRKTLLWGTAAAAAITLGACSPSTKIHMNNPFVGEMVRGAVQTPTGTLDAFSKAKGLDSACFSSVELKVPEADKFDLTWDNTTIFFVNVDRNGRVESRQLDRSSGDAMATTRGAKTARELDAFLKPGSARGLGDFAKVQEILSNAGRPAAGQETADGYPVRDLRNVPRDKTPFYQSFAFEGAEGATPTIDKYGHFFFYVLMDDQVTYRRDTAALVPTLPASKEALFSPFIQYPVVPKMANNPAGSAEVLSVHFYQGGDINKRQSAGGNMTCVYPYALDVIASGQASFAQSTPVIIDPEVETRGPIPGGGGTPPGDGGP